ncbi:hypothetical protein SAMN04487785_11749 [Dyella jiangningensis]|uniref:nuclear transport factor 2 family protein n=1 Tax=Dyella sp. AtDHG13 TaxID=1938897 RepID=UPI0008808349|nr:nuclear transport factor 2 family protein [Dyella sp. AtDHG13]PXV59033.1 hypothetical protein BDW41_10477 [Dyella sp. AtDHG13]SDL28838.1 hypothetical protein SAMN04487785_11749 [Dyella jiangningensis]
MLRSPLFRRSNLNALIGAMTLCAIAFHAHAADPTPAECAKIATPSQQRDAATIQRIEQAWLTAEYRGHPEYLACLLEPDYHTSSRSGLVRSRQDVIDRVPQVSNDAKEVPKLDTIVVIHGDAATAHSILRTTDKAGNPKEVHFVDGYTFHDGRWFAFSGADL